jgi:hypothetical protein
MTCLSSVVDSFNFDILGKIAKTRYDYRNELGLTVQELYSGFDIAFKRDLFLNSNIVSIELSFFTSD